MATYNPFRKTVFNAEKEIPSLAGKVILVTGGTGGLGQQTVVSIAQHDPAHVYFTGRSQPGADQTIKLAAEQAPKTPVSFIKCDLASLESVRNVAKDFLSKESRLDILNANAGIMAVPAGLTTDGYEIQFGTNHVGHALLVKLLTPLMLQTAKLPGADVRIVWDSSLGHKGHTSAGIEFDTLKTPQEGIMGGRFVSSTLGLGPWVRYAQSKLANILYAREFAKRYPSITSVSVHPGVSATGLVDGLNWMQKIFVYSTSYAMMIPAEQCAWNQQWAMTAKLGKGEKEVENGLYYEPVGVKARSTKRGEDDELARRLWEWTEKELEEWKL